MSSGRFELGPGAEAGIKTRSSIDPALLGPAATSSVSSSVVTAIDRTRDWLLEQQAAEGYWVGELEGDTILESEYILLLTWLGRGQSDEARRAARYILSQQQPHGGWSQFPGGPIEISASVKAYLALKITGQDPASTAMLRACAAIRAAGGVERVNSFTRYYLALLGILEYRQCPAVPPELLLLPNRFPLSIYEMSSWSRTIVVPLSLLWAFQPKVTLPREQRIDELFLASAAEMPLSMPPCELLDDLKQQGWVNWGSVFRGIDRVWKTLEWLHIKPLRRRAVAAAKRWMLERFEASDGLGAIFPPIIWSIIGLRCLGYENDSPEVLQQLQELEKLTIREGDTDRLEPCRSPVWDTAIAALALREAELPAESEPLRRAVDWLLSKECRRRGDWSVKRPDVEPGGWFFEFRNDFYPDVDDTAMVVMALAECLPRERTMKLRADLILGTVEQPPLTVVSGRSQDEWRSVSDIASMRQTLDAMRRGVRWMQAMQCRDGGWGAFDVDNDREILTRVPFADHNAMIDPPTADITARVCEMFGRCGLRLHPVIDRALQFVWNDQQPDGSWYGRWGVNYIYGTWQVIVGLTQVGVPANDPRLQRAADWLESVQQPDGGWGETAQSYDHPRLKGTGPQTASQTAWALMGLMAAGRLRSEAVRRGIEWLVATQNRDGTWTETEFTGTGFPKVFYLRYHLYRISFPLMALGRYRRLMTGQAQQ